MRLLDYLNVVPYQMSYMYMYILKWENTESTAVSKMTALATAYG